MWWQEQSPSLNSSKRSNDLDLDFLSPDIDIKMMMPNTEEFQKLSNDKQIENLLFMVQRLLPLIRRMDSLTESVTTLANRVGALEVGGVIKGSNPDCDTSNMSCAESLTDKPDSFIIQRSKEINKYVQ